MLHEALNMLEMNDIHLLNWGSTRIAGFLDACIQASNIIVPFLIQLYLAQFDLMKQNFSLVRRVMVLSAFFLLMKF